MSSQQNYFNHLSSISKFGLLYKQKFVARIIRCYTKKYGGEIADIGCGIGSGILGAYPSLVIGYDINSQAVDYCVSKGYKAEIISDGTIPSEKNKFDVCVLDNVIEHIDEYSHVLSECSRITKKNGAIVVIVPGHAGYALDSDHKVFFGEEQLKSIHTNLSLKVLISLPFFIKSTSLSRKSNIYGLMAIYENSKDD